MICISYIKYIVELAGQQAIILDDIGIYVFQTRLEIMPNQKRKEVCKRAVRLRRQRIQRAGKVSV